MTSFRQSRNHHRWWIRIGNNRAQGTALRARISVLAARSLDPMKQTCGELEKIGAKAIFVQAMWRRKQTAKG